MKRHIKWNFYESTGNSCPSGRPLISSTVKWESSLRCLYELLSFDHPVASQKGLHSLSSPTFWASIIPWSIGLSETTFIWNGHFSVFVWFTRTCVQNFRCAKRQEGSHHKSGIIHEILCIVFSTGKCSHLSYPSQNEGSALGKMTPTAPQLTLDS